MGPNINTWNKMCLKSPNKYQTSQHGNVFFSTMVRNCQKKWWPKITQSCLKWSLFTSPGWPKNDIIWKSLVAIIVTGVPWDVPRPWHLPRDSSHHDTPSTFQMMSHCTLYRVKKYMDSALWSVLMHNIQCKKNITNLHGTLWGKKDLTVRVPKKLPFVVFPDFYQYCSCS